MPIIAIDAGFGDTKVSRYDDGGKIKNRKFPTAITYKKEGLGLGGYAIEERVYSLNGKELIVGEGALFDAFGTRDIDFLIKYSPVLVYKALEDAGALDACSAIALGLPLGEFGKYQPLLLSSMKKAVVNGRMLGDFEIKIYPQGVGASWDYVCDGDNVDEKKANLNTVVVDIGFNTLDVVVMSGGKALPESFMEPEFGLVRVIKELRAYIQNRFEINLTEQDAKGVLISKVIAGKKLETKIRELLENYREWLSDEIRAKIPERIKRADAIIWSGGGAYYLDVKGGSLEDKSYVVDEPEYANSRGFLKLCSWVKESEGV